MRFAYAKIGTGNLEIDEYLLSASDKFIPIFFDCTYSNEKDFLERGGAKEQGRLFFEFGHDHIDKFVVVTARGFVHIFRPTGPVIFSQRKDSSGNARWVKLLPVESLVSTPTSAVPAVLAGINANRYYSSGTFREIKSPGNIAALRHIIGAGEGRSSSRELSETLSLLGSVELETLVARILDEHGLFVPAHHGGTMQDADLFAHNDAELAVDVAGLVVEAGSSISIQVKISSTFKLKPIGIDYVICANGCSAPWQLTSTWLSAALLMSPNTTKWLKRALNWAPDEYKKAIPSAP